MTVLRDYQTRSLTMLYDWMRQNDGHPCVVLPTGSGKSVVIAELCRQAVSEWPETRILMLTKSMELITQNAQKLRAVWPNAPLGIYSASVGRKDLGEPITIGGPLSIVNVLDQLGSISLLIVDECHDISHKEEGTYRKIIAHLLSVNPDMRVVGYTASPYRMGHGLITDKPAIFDGMIEPVSIEELVHKGYLSILRSKSTDLRLSTEGVKKRGGEFIESDLQRAVDTEDNNRRMVQEVIARASGRKSWMFFCTGVSHAEHIRDLLIEHGVSAVAVTGEMAKRDREQAISDFRSGKITAVTNVNCLSTGFDHAEIDLLVMARPTMSPGLYLQQAGRGMRVAPGKADCLVLDFAGVVARHGPITAVQPPSRQGKGEGDPPVKACPECHELVAISAKACSACGFVFPLPPPKKLELRSDDIMGLEGSEIEVSAWRWRPHTSRASGKLMLSCTYYAGMTDPPITEYLPVLHEGYAGQRAMEQLGRIAEHAQVHLAQHQTLDTLAAVLSRGKHPRMIEVKKDGRFHRVLRRQW